MSDEERTWKPGDSPILPEVDPSGYPPGAVELPEGVHRSPSGGYAADVNLFPVELLPSAHDRKDARRARRAQHRATQVAFPWRSALGSGVATFTAVLLAVAAVSPILGPFVDRYVPGAGAGVVGFGLFCGGLAVLVKRIANLPAVTDLLVRLGIGPVPKS